jgi:AcrR family transcriptional regulator
VTEFSGSGDPVRSLELLWRVHVPPTRGPKQRLDLDQIVGAAIALADGDGLGALSMRKVAERLKVGTMSLYTYVPGKPELLDLMLDAAIEASAPYDADAPWRTRLEKVARENWDRFHRHPWLLEVTPLRPVLGPNTIARYDHELTALDGIGLTDIEMDSALTLLNAHTESAARRALEASQAEQRSGITDEQWWAARAPVLERVIEPGRFPVASRVGTAAGEVHNAAYAPEHAFMFGLARVLDGVEFLTQSRGSDG